MSDLPKTKTMTKNQKLGTGVGGGVGGGAVLIMLYSWFFPERPLTEIDIIGFTTIAGVLGPLINRFLPTER